MTENALGSAAPIERTHRRRWGVWALAIVGIAVLLAAGAAFIVVRGTQAYFSAYDGRILPGATVAGVDVSRMTPQKALRAVRAEIGPKLDRKITVRYNDRSWSATPRGLGASSNAKSAVRRAVAASGGLSFVEQARMRWLDEEFSFRAPVAISYPKAQARQKVEAIAQGVDRKPVDASLDYSTGFVKIRPDRVGVQVLVGKSHEDLVHAIRNGSDNVQLTVDIQKPETTAAAYEDVLLVRIGENRLYHYEDGKVADTYTVATGLPEYPTPTGLYELTEKRYMPTWINPDPTGWGASMPESIGPGPSNPLGTRALNWSASGIRFHGTLATSSLGTQASHGCVRLSMPDIEHLYDKVDVGTPIVSLIGY
ncbi:MAG: L,D-transpeptidase/peptidoglycan binding protein [Actinomycetota bacterium]|nr:L,D-transpeptidase/peptidoglycan binding protein [Actinomycetota bacterium]